MEMIENSSFGIIDYCVFIVVLVVSLGIGLYTALRGNQSPEEFLMGNRDFGPIPVGISLLISFVSAVSLLGFSGEAYAHGLQISLFIVGIAFGIATASIVTIPVIHPLKLTSINEYLQLRFKSPRLRIIVTIMTCTQWLLYTGVCLYAPTLALATVTPLSSLTYIFILGIVVTIYSSIGGIRAVVWTDVFQLVVMVAGLIITVGAGLYVGGGFTKVWNTALAGGRLDIFNTNPSIYERHNVYNSICFGIMMFSSYFGVAQVNTQRICSVRTTEDAIKVLWICGIGMVVIYVLIFGGGVIAYAAYAGCDPWLRGLIEKKEEIVPYFIVDRLNFITGLAGVFVATIIGGALSSLSSVISAVVAMIWEDFLIKIKFFANVKKRTAGLINKFLSLVIGLVVIGAAILSSKATSLMQFTLTITSAMLGPVFGVFLLGFLFPKTNLKGVWAGMLFALITVGWISCGAFLYGKNPKILPLSTEECSSVTFNVTGFDSSKTSYDIHYENSTKELVQDDSGEDFPLMKLYRISYTLYLFTGTFSCIIVGLIVSFLTGNQDLKEVSPQHISPFIRKLYWKEKDLLSLELEEQKFRSQKANKSEMKQDNIYLYEIKKFNDIY